MIVPGTATLRVTAARPGRVEMDDRQVGRYEGAEPLIVTGVSGGQHEVKVYFDGGGNYAQRAFTTAGQFSDVHVPLSKVRTLFPHRKGFHLGVSGGAHYMRYDILDIHGDELNGGGIHANFIMNLGVAPAVDLRSGVELRVGGSEADVVNTLLGVPFHIQLNLGGVYAMRWGGSVGVDLLSAGGGTNAEFYAAPHGSPAVFRFGAKRQFEVSLDGGAAFTFPAGVVFAQIFVGPSFTALLLSD